ncbi:ATP-binding SpoIIE family protein phosphatase [Kineococcus terrestris]|uniref:ATP-binding SpoIIE family protein phosphatase n=1 Tax=Kineococcus terrestris TaxID=2044856 RepID=UPI0034DB5FD4
MHAQRSPGGADRAEALRLAAVRDWVDLTRPPPVELQAVVRLARRVTGAPHAVVNIIDEHLQRQLAADGCERGECAREDSMCHYALRAGGLVHAPDARRDVRFAANPWVDGRLGAVRSYTSAPLVTPEGLSLGTLCVFGEQVRELTAQQRADLADLAHLVVGVFARERAARLEVESAQALRQAQRAAETARALQTALLPRGLPTSPAVSLTSRYLPGTDGVDVGGDFYDAVRTDGALVLVMGDVQGHSTAAAAAMGQVRTAVHAYVSEGHDPCTVLERTNRLVQDLEGDLFATCCLVRLDERTGEVVVASAGHPLPLRFAPGHVEELDVEPGPPLGVQEETVYTEARHRLPGAARLLLYTDGLAEWARGGPLDGWDAVAGTLRAHADEDAGALADRLLAPVAHVRADDAALLLVDYAGPASGALEARLLLPADPRAVAVARDYLRATLDRWDLAGTVDAAELVVSELVTNAVLHAGSGAALTLRHDAALARLSVGVDDTSTSQPRPRDGGEDALGGRGMHIVDVVADRWWVAPRGDGKTVWADLLTA